MAAAALICSLIASFIAALGLATANLGIVSPFVGFRLFAAGALLGGLASVVISLVGLVLARGGRDPEGRTKSLGGLAIGLGLLIVVLASASTGADAPPINDITTDLENPPEFASSTVVPDYVGRNMNYPEEFVEVVRASYSDLTPLHVDSAPEATFARALAAAEALGWEIVARSESRGVFDAQHVSSVFRFVDDITVRIVADAGGSRVDMRSKSRVGQSDLGANAARIREFFAALD